MKELEHRLLIVWYSCVKNVTFHYFVIFLRNHFKTGAKTMTIRTSTYFFFPVIIYNILMFQWMVPL